MLCLVTFHDFLPHSQTLSRKLAASGQMKCTITLIKTRNLLLVWRLWKAFGIVKVYNLTKYTTKGWFVSDISVQKCHMFTVLFVTRASLKNRVHHQVKVLEPLSHGGEIPELTWHKFAHPVWPVSRAILSHFLHILILCLFAERKQCFFFQIYYLFHSSLLSVGNRCPQTSCSECRQTASRPLGAIVIVEPKFF